MKRLCLTLLLTLVGCWSLVASPEKSTTIVSINGQRYYIHQVAQGETLYGLAHLYGVSEETLRQANPAVASGLRAGEQVKVPFVGMVENAASDKRARKNFQTHTVERGETLYAIARRYAIPVQTIIADNPGLDPTHLSLKQRILIRKNEVGTSSEEGNRQQLEELRSSLDRVAEPGVAYYTVVKGDTFYNLARRFETTEAELSHLNAGMMPADLKVGALIKVPGAPQTADVPSESTDEPAVTGEDRYGDRHVQEVVFTPLRRSETLRVVLMLPLTTGGNAAANSNYLDFYQGFLMGLDSVRMKGYSVDVHLYRTTRDAEQVKQLIAEEQSTFDAAHLIIGPVYEAELYPVLTYAESRGIPVVSPLANLEEMNSDVLFQMAPDPKYKYDKFRQVLNSEKRLTLIYTATTDLEFEREMLALIGDRPYTRHTYVYEHPNAVAGRGENSTSPADLTPLLDNDEDNLFVIMSDKEVDVDRVLAALASANTNLLARSLRTPRFAVLGNSRWNRYNNLDRSILFKDRVIFTSIYHAKRDAEVVRRFDASYIRVFGTLPTLFSYRGYDAASIFAPAMYNDMEYKMESRRYTPLQSTYLFSPAEGRHNHVNTNWMLVKYNADFTITIE